MTTARWVGWVWDAKTRDWLSVCHAQDMVECHRELIAYAEAQGVRMKDTVMTGGHHPWERPATEGRAVEKGKGRLEHDGQLEGDVHA